MGAVLSASGSLLDALIIQVWRLSSTEDTSRVDFSPARSTGDWTRSQAARPMPADTPASSIRKDTDVRFMILIKADTNTEAGALPDEKLLTEMGKFNEELVKAGVMLAGEGLHPSSKGARVKFSGAKRTVIDGPFSETKELIAGFWLWQVKSKEEAIEWVKRCPNPTEGESEVEIRQVFEAEDFGAEFTPELRAQEERLRAKIAKS
jgi:hypothetical protein